MLPDSPAASTNLATGDRILQVEGIRLESSDHLVAVEAIKNAEGPEISFIVQSLLSNRDEPGEQNPPSSTVSYLLVCI